MCLFKQVIVAWNGLAISAFVRASRILLTEPQGISYEFPVTGCHVISPPTWFSLCTMPSRIGVRLVKLKWNRILRYVAVIQFVFHVLQLILIRLYARKLVLHQQICYETSAKTGLRIGPPPI